MKKKYIKPQTKISGMLSASFIAASSGGNSTAEVGAGGNHGTGNDVGGTDTDGEGAGVKRFYSSYSNW